jgi:hypothetical protein
MSGSARKVRWEDRSKELGRLYDEMDFQQRAAYYKGGPATMCPAGPIDAEKLKWIDHLVMSLDIDECPPFTIIPRQKAGPEFRASPIGWELLKVDDVMLFQVPAGIRCSERVELFRRIYSEMRGALPGWRRFQDGKLPQNIRVEEVAWFNALAARVKTELKNPDIRKAIQASDSAAEKRYQDACTYVDSLFRKAPDLLIIAMDLGMSSPHAGHMKRTLAGELDTQDKGDDEKRPSSPPVVAGVQKMLAKGRHRQALSRMVGFMGRWGHSEVKGTYARVVFFLDSSKVADEQAAADAIGREWEEDFSNGLGIHNLSYLSRKDAGKFVPFSRINRSDRQRRNILRQGIVLYLTKLGLVFHPAEPSLHSYFFRGELPSADIGKGRRKKEASLSKPAPDDATQLVEEAPAIREAEPTSSSLPQDSKHSDQESNTSESEVEVDGKSVPAEQEKEGGSKTSLRIWDAGRRRWVH